MLPPVRTVVVPPARKLLPVTVTGPIHPREAKTAEQAVERLTLALKESARVENDDLGWCCWWASPVSRSGSTAHVSLWVLDDAAGLRSQRALQSRLEASHFLVRAIGYPRTPRTALLCESPLHVRLREANMGDLLGEVPLRFEIGLTTTEVEVEPQWRWPVQRCPRCGHKDHPLERILGYPTPAAEFTAQLGEAVYAGCTLGEDHHVAECRSCGEGFQPWG